MKAKEAEFEEKTEGLRRENTDLEKQLGTASQTILDLVERHKTNQKRKEEERLCEAGVLDIYVHGRYDTSVRYVATSKVYAVINNMNDPSIATRFARRRTI